MPPRDRRSDPYRQVTTFVLRLQRVQLVPEGETRVHPHSERSAVPRWAPIVAGVSVALLVFTATPSGAAFAASAQGFLSFFGGVLSLVAYSGAVMIGLLATDRTMLAIRHRVLAQVAHRTMA